MKKCLSIFVFFSFVLSAGLRSYGQNIPSKPNPPRLVVDKAGVFTYSNTLIVNFSLGVMELYPNPTTNGIVYLKNNAVFTGNKPLQVELLDQTGKKLMLQTYPTAGISKITIQLPPGLAAGTYFVRGMNADGKKQIWKLQVRP